MKEIGRYQQLVVEQDIEGFVLLTANAVGWTREEITVYLAQYRREVQSGKHHAYYWQRVLWARKPGSAAS